jgi:peptide/nickel transport system ATP-binding protein
MAPSKKGRAADPTSPEPQPLLSIRDLGIAFGRNPPYLHAVQKASLDIRQGEIVGLIGQSGSGKTTLAMALMGLIRGAPGIWTGTAKLEQSALLPDMQGLVRLSESGEIKKKYLGFQQAQRKRLKPLLGRDIAMIFQEPRASLDPYFTIGEHLLESLHRNRDRHTGDLKQTAARLLTDVGIVDAEKIMGVHPHAISGGMAQRVMVAMALAARPKLLIADEPSTALDVTTQAKLLRLFRKLRDTHHLSLLLISHDIGVIQEVCDRIYVMHRGSVIEAGQAGPLLAQPGHPYTASLLESFTHFGERAAIPPTQPEKGVGCSYRGLCAAYRKALSPTEKLQCEQVKPPQQNGEEGAQALVFTRCHFPGYNKRSEAPSDSPSIIRGQGGSSAIVYRSAKPKEEPSRSLRLEPAILTVADLKKTFKLGGETFEALREVSLQIAKGRTYGLVGESGSGKSTLGLSVMRLQPFDSGRVEYLGRDIGALKQDELRALRREYRMLFQHPEGVLNSGMKISEILAEGLEREGNLSQGEIQRRVTEALTQVQLDPSHADRYPGNLSSGEKQRVTIARAIITKPQFLVCDEPVASLDLAIQSQVLALLKDFQQKLGLTYLFISHNLELVRLLADRIGVMYMGTLVEEAPVSDFSVDKVKHPYTRLLLASVPSMGRPDLEKILEKYPDVEPSRLSEGCPFRNRCPHFLTHGSKECGLQMPPLRTFLNPDGETVRVACHFPLVTAAQG